MRNPIKTYLAKKRNQARLAKYMQVAPSTVLLQQNCLDMRVAAEDRKYVTIGERGLIKALFTFETEKGEVRIGNNTHIGGAQFICRSGITAGNDVTMAWGITLYDHDSHSTDWEYRQHDNEQCYVDYMATGNNIAHKDWSHVKTAPIVIEDKVWIGMDVLVLKGVTIGEGAVVAAKSVVTKDVPAWTLVAGSPAKVVKDLRNEKQETRNEN